ncbi:MAG: Ribosomal-protein-alanine acetyltransferase [Fimbriimonadaceae bacterium]|nr:Ribosomal-protein-alanine acetyltransferase [Fimbriimonadaceae bacterium]
MKAAKGVPIRIVPFNEHHLSQVLALEVAVHGSPWSERGFRNELENPHSVFVVAALDDEVIGYAGLWKVIDEAHVTNVVVDPTYRRRGIARQLISHILRQARDAGIRCATLEVRASNDAARLLYEGFGFVVTNRRRRYYPDNGEDALLMWLHDLQGWNS